MTDKEKRIIEQLKIVKEYFPELWERLGFIDTYNQCPFVYGIKHQDEQCGTCEDDEAEMVCNRCWDYALARKWDGEK